MRAAGHGDHRRPTRRSALRDDELPMMIFIALIGLLVGVVLGQRFKVLVLVPGIGLALVFAIAVGVADADGGWTIVLMAMTAITSLQIGYLAGIGIRHFRTTARANYPARHLHERRVN
jgi:hypothetical protein